MLEPAVEIDCITHEYPGGVCAVCGLSLTIERGETVVILGPNGSGKTTLLHHVLGLLKPKEGVIRVLGYEMPDEAERARDAMGVVLQDVDDQLIMPTVLEDVAFGLVARGVPRDEAERRAMEVLRELNLEELADRPPQFLSGGQKRMVALAGAVVTDPELLILDEPTTGLDHLAAERFVEVLSGLKEDRPDLTVLLTTFDVDVAASLADRVVLMKEGTVSVEGPPEEVLTDPGLLREHGIKPPEHVELLSRLGVDSPPLDVEEAVEVLRSMGYRG